MKSNPVILRLAFVLLFLGGLTSSYAQHYVIIGGMITEDTELRCLGGDSAYLVTQSLSVPNGVTLTFEPGVVAYFMQNSALNVSDGSLVMNGNANDSIYLLCYELSRDWPGVQVKSSSDHCRLTMNYTEFSGAVSAISVIGSASISISNCEFYNYYGGIGISLTDCSNSIISHCRFLQCLTGVELHSRQANSTGIRISDNVFSQGQINLAVSNLSTAYHCYDYHIVGNCFQGASTAMYFEAYGGLSFRNRKNFIQNNIITSDIPDNNLGYHSYGIKTSMDSLMIQNNIFWDNDEAINMIESCDLFAVGNTFYRNGNCLTDAQDQCSILFEENVFSETKGLIMEIPSDLVTFHHNNFLNFGSDVTLFKNNCSSSIDFRENYWQVHTADSIERLIVDDNDNVHLGPIVYDDFLSGCDTTAPVSPPHDVRKQYIDGEWIVSWDANPEADIHHYALFYGDFEYYRFGNHVDSIFEQSYPLDIQNIDNVAVVALDGYHDLGTYVLNGKSAYAFAMLSPFAGADAILCMNEGSLVLDEATIPFQYESLYWSTSGSGHFENSHSLNTEYIPSTEDFDAGQVKLTLNVVTEDGILTSSLRLVLRESPSVFAGDDYFSGILRPLELTDAEASSYDSVYWRSLGDGSFADSSLLHTEYYPGQRDLENGFVSLVLFAASYCDLVSDTVTYQLVEEYSLEGKTWIDGVPAGDAQVIAVSLTDSEVPYLSGFYRTVADSEGYFKFNRLIAGQYVLYAFTDTLENQSGGSYYLNKLQWQNATSINLNGNAFDIDIALPPVATTFPEGTARISGTFDTPSGDFKAFNFYCKSWIRDAGDVVYCDGGLSNVSVSLMNMDQSHLLAYTITDQNGNFCFSNLPYGTYLLMSDVPRYGIGTSRTIVLSPDNQNVDDVHLFIDEGGKVEAKGISPYSNGTATPCVLFPNPVEETLFVAGLPDDGAYSYRIIDCQGVEMKAISQPSRMLGLVTIDVSFLERGLYLLVMEANGVTSIERFVKN